MERTTRLLSLATRQAGPRVTSLLLTRVTDAQECGGTVEPTAALAKGRLGTETLVILASFPFVSHCSFIRLGRLNLIPRGKPVPALWANWPKGQPTGTEG